MWWDIPHATMWYYVDGSMNEWPSNAGDLTERLKRNVRTKDARMRRTGIW